MATEGEAAVAVVGSYNHALTMTVGDIPAPGETVLGHSFEEGVGGKGSNQAIAVARLGADARFIGRLGDDRFADAAEALWAENGVRTHVERDPDVHTGVGFVVVAENGENAITVAPGANSELDEADVRQHADVIGAADVVLCQLETETTPVITTGEIASERDTTFVLNPAPARQLPERLLELADVLTPNRAEAKVLTGADAAVEPVELAASLRESGAANVVLTLGGDGALVLTEAGPTDIDPVQVDVVDTTGAGDAFNAGLAVALTEGRDIEAAARFAARAGAAACTAYEVVPALPRRGSLP
ncbi:MAG: ribokinase [Halobacteriales archaeon]